MYTYLEHPNQYSIFENKMVDMAVYTPNRAFRMLGCCKWNTSRFLSDGNPLTFDHWKNNKVQPCDINSLVIIDHITEPGGELPGYKCGNGFHGVTGWKPECLDPVLDFLSEKYATVTRIHAYPLSFRFSCNLNTKLCPFKGEAHSKNIIYACIDLCSKRYRIKCHSQKCYEKTTEYEDIPDCMHGAIDAYLNEPIINLGAVKIT